MFYRRFAVFLPLPALITSLFIFLLAETGRGIYLQQIIVAVLAFLLCVWTTRVDKPSPTGKPALNLICIALILLLLPILLNLIQGKHVEAQRWLNLGGLRIYLAACLLPSCLFLIDKVAQTASLRQPLIAFSSMIPLALAMQTDAAQATAFSAAILVLFWHRGFSLTQIVFLIAINLISLTLAWINEPSLNPVSYVEGVIQLASAHHLIAGIWTMLATLILPGGLAWLAWSRQHQGIAALALYYPCISGFAYAQLTPMPLLGFGASPIIGYFLLASLLRRT